MSSVAEGGQTHDMGPRPRISTPKPRITDSDRLDHLTVLVEDIRNLLATLTSAAPGAAMPPAAAAESPAPDKAGPGVGRPGLTRDDLLNAAFAARLTGRHGGRDLDYLDYYFCLAARLTAAAKAMK